ncbi:Stimulated by retinoic acid gene 6 protein-like protein [Trichoplax sp. H2]|nr:Stimulated by retinoic acid gene 6 protein-like protein [Trichoplax sp. H2]|eukprot:RDD47541.1 Stimulated by retinoic acid gene 6 protein-like protein [Trichoplax sp. H2]
MHHVIDNNSSLINYTCRPFLNEGPAIWSQYPAALGFIPLFPGCYHSYPIANAKEKIYAQVLQWLSRMDIYDNFDNYYTVCINLIHSPVNLLEVGENRFGYAMAFGASTTAVLALFTNQTFDRNYWVSVLLGIFIVFRVSVVYYPLFACLSSKFRLLGAVLGFLHSADIAAIHLLGVIYCPSFQSLGPYSNVVLNIPIFICLAWLECHFGYLIILAIYNHVKGITQKEKLRPFVHLQNYQFIHVKLLLKAAEESDFETEEEKKPNSVRAFLTKYLYKPKPHFKYPPRILCTFVVAAIALYEITVMYYYLASNIFNPFENWVMQYSEYLTIVLNASKKDNLQFVYNCRDTWIVVTVIASSLNALYLSHMLILYRINKFKLYRGEKSELPIDKYTSFGSVIQSSICYAGYQISYMLWAFVAIHFILCLGILFVIYCIIYPLEGVGSTWFLDFVIPIATCTILINIWQFLVSKYFFCQEHGNINALDNRRLYHNFDYFIFFYNVMCGFFSCLFRIGFDGYLGFLYVEHIHCHPVLVTFCEILLNKDFIKSSHDMKVAYYGGSDDEKWGNPRESEFKIRNIQAYNRWRVAVLLIRNKTLRKLRKGYLEELREIEKLEEEHHEDQAAIRRRKLSVNSLLDNVRRSNYDIANSVPAEANISNDVIHNTMEGSNESLATAKESSRQNSQIISNVKTAVAPLSPTGSSHGQSNDEIETVRQNIVLEVVDKKAQFSSLSNSMGELSGGVKTNTDSPKDENAARRRPPYPGVKSRHASNSTGNIARDHEGKEAREYLL